MFRIDERFPDPTRPDARRIIFERWRVGTRERQRAAIDQIPHAWSRSGWPEGLLAHAVFGTGDGEALLHYLQWTDDDSIEAFRALGQAAWFQQIDGEVPGIRRDEEVRTRLHRSMQPGDPRELGCLVVVSFQTDGPAVQQGFIDGLLGQVEETPGAHHPGAISSHFHLATDGSRILNYSEWRSASDHEEMLATRLQQDGAFRAFIDGFPGLRPLGFERFEPRLSMTAEGPLPQRYQ